jgi:hypothetical protein
MRDCAGPATASEEADELETLRVHLGSVFVGEGAQTRDDDGRPSG